MRGQAIELHFVSLTKAFLAHSASIWEASRTLLSFPLKLSCDCCTDEGSVLCSQTVCVLLQGCVACSALKLYLQVFCSSLPCAAVGKSCSQKVEFGSLCISPFLYISCRGRNHCVVGLWMKHEGGAREDVV